MRMPRFHIGTMMIVIALIALFVSVGGSTDKRITIPVACVVGPAYGLGSMRRPLWFLAPLVAFCILVPAVDHPSQNLFNASILACLVGWIIVGPIAWLNRTLRKLDSPDP